MEKTIRLTVAQAIVRFLDQQYVLMDQEEQNCGSVFYIFRTWKLRWDWGKRWIPIPVPCA